MVVVVAVAPLIPNVLERWGKHASEVGTKAWLRDVALDLDVFIINLLSS